jgi:hypothetical protein
VFGLESILVILPEVPLGGESSREKWHYQCRIVTEKSFSNSSKFVLSFLKVYEIIIMMKHNIASASAKFEE